MSTQNSILNSPYEEPKKHYATDLEGNLEKGRENLAKTSTKRQAEKTLRIEVDDEAFDRIYGYTSHPIAVHPVGKEHGAFDQSATQRVSHGVKKEGQKIAVRVISQFGEESRKVLMVNSQ